MAKKQKQSFFDKLLGNKVSDEDKSEKESRSPLVKEDDSGIWEATNQAEEADGELALDVYQTPTDIIVQTFVAGVKPEDLEINITRDMLTLRGRRFESHGVKEHDFFSRELYWGSFSRVVSLPQEVEPEEAEAVEKHGLLTIRLPKIDRNKNSHLKVKSL